MESIVHYVMSHGTMVITVLIGSIILCVFGLLIMSFHSPKAMMAQEFGNVERLEGVLRQILSDQSWPAFRGGSAANGAPADAVPGTPGGEAQVEMLQGQVAILEKEVREKQKQLDEILQASPDNPDAAPLKIKIKELEDKLSEYSVIEEDIADLSRYRQENEELRNKITEATGMAAPDALAMPWDEFEKIVKEKKAHSAKDNVATSMDKAE